MEHRARSEYPHAPTLPLVPDEFSPLSARSTCGSSSGSSDRRTVGYYESWSYSKSCGWKPEDLFPQLLTHLNFAFALVGADNRIASMGANDIDLYRRTTALKSQNPALKVFISVGGWDAGAQGFSRMASSAGNRATFISSVVAFMSTYAFDGIDIDWEYPVADDRGGVTADKANYVLCRFLQTPPSGSPRDADEDWTRIASSSCPYWKRLTSGIAVLKELRAALSWDKGITIAVPSSYCKSPRHPMRRRSCWMVLWLIHTFSAGYLQHFDLAGLSQYVDWFNLMSYDIHVSNRARLYPSCRPSTAYWTKLTVTVIRAHGTAIVNGRLR